MRQGCVVSLWSGRKTRCVSLLWLFAKPEKEPEPDPQGRTMSNSGKPINYSILTIQSTEGLCCLLIHATQTACMSDCEFLFNFSYISRSSIPKLYVNTSVNVLLMYCTSFTVHFLFFCEFWAGAILSKTVL